MTLPDDWEAPRWAPAVTAASITAETGRHLDAGQVDPPRFYVDDAIAQRVRETYGITREEVGL